MLEKNNNYYNYNNLKKVLIGMLIIVVATTIVKTNILSSIATKFRIPKVINTEYFRDDSATISRVSVLNGISRVHMHSAYGEYRMSNTQYYQKYKNNIGETVIVKFEEKFYDDGHIDIIPYEINDINDIN